MAKKKGNWKIWAAALGALLIIGGVAGGGEEKPEPTRSAVATEEPAPTAAPTPSPVPTPTEIPTATPERIHGWPADKIVYVSSSGVIHTKKDCSGMKHYTEMTMKEADGFGYELCERCG